MALESGTYIDSLNASNPVATDGLAQADDHMRLIKSTILASFPSISGAVNATHTEITTVADGDTAATSTTLVDADRVPVNDDGTMVQVALSDFKTYMNSNITTINGLTYPAADGNAGEFITTNGSGTLSFAAQATAFLSGMILPYAGISAPTGWLPCFGQALNTFTYKDLHAVISNTYGGDVYNAGVTDQSGATTTFNLPDLRGRTIAGQDDMGGTSADRLTNQTGGLDGDTLGATGGTETHTLALTELPDSYYYNSNLTSIDDYVDNHAGSNFVARVADVTSHTTQGGGGAHNNVQPTIVLNYIIKT